MYLRYMIRQLGYEEHGNRILGIIQAGRVCAQYDMISLKATETGTAPTKACGKALSVSERHNQKILKVQSC